MFLNFLKVLSSYSFHTSCEWIQILTYMGMMEHSGGTVLGDRQLPGVAVVHGQNWEVALVLPRSCCRSCALGSCFNMHVTVWFCELRVTNISERKFTMSIKLSFISATNFLCEVLPVTYVISVLGCSWFHGCIDIKAYKKLDNIRLLYWLKSYLDQEARLQDLNNWASHVDLD